MNRFKVIGLMSGTSLDGVDIAFCYFEKHRNNWIYKISEAETYPYPDYWINKLKNLEKSDAQEFAFAHVEYGHYLGTLINDFINKNKIFPEFISSHGHTIFHQPEKRFTFQIGSGAAISAETRHIVVSDFRTLDVALGGQGAPLVPIGDMILFKDFYFCINLGGFANISYSDSNKNRIAYDICPFNIVLNHLSQQLGYEFDNEGKLASEGRVNSELLEKLDNLNYYKHKYPKSLGKEWVLKEIFPLLNLSNIDIKDKLCTFSEHIVNQLNNATSFEKNKNILLTGGGTYNKYIVERLKAITNNKIFIPDNKTIDYKEALIFAFLGVLRILNKPNCLKTVTGSKYDNVGGSVYFNK